MDEMTNDLVETNDEYEGMMAVEKTKVIGEIQAALVIAKKFPRDENEAFKRIMKSCERHSLASKAIYKYTKGQAIEGPTIRLAEMCAQAYGNLDFGMKELSRQQGKSIVQSYCWDLETNVKRVMQFEVDHAVDLTGGDKKILTSGRDIYEHIANYGSRRLRNCILGIIPKDFIDEAVLKCRQTMAKHAAGDTDEPLSDKVRKLSSAFGKAGVSIEMLEKYLDHSLDTVTVDEFVDLMTIFNGIKDKQATRADFFDVPTEKITKAKDVIEMLKKVKESEPSGGNENDEQKIETVEVVV